MLSKTFTYTSRQRPKRFENQTNTRPRKWVNSSFPTWQVMPALQKKRATLYREKRRLGLG